MLISYTTKKIFIKIRIFFIDRSCNKHHYVIILGQYILLIQSELIELSEVELNKESR